MKKEDFFKVAATLVSGSPLTEWLCSPRGEEHLSLALRIAYNSALDAWAKIPNRGHAPTTHN